MYNSYRILREFLGCRLSESSTRIRTRHSIGDLAVDRGYLEDNGSHWSWKISERQLIGLIEQLNHPEDFESLLTRSPQSSVGSVSRCATRYSKVWDEVVYEPYVELLQRTLLILDAALIEDPHHFYGPRYASGWGGKLLARAELESLSEELVRIEPFIEAGLVDLYNRGSAMSVGQNVLHELSLIADLARPTRTRGPEDSGYMNTSDAQSELFVSLVAAVSFDVEMLYPDLSSSPFASGRSFSSAERALNCRIPNVALISTEDFLAMRRDGESFAAIRSAVRRCLSAATDYSDVDGVLRLLDEELGFAQRLIDEDTRVLGMDIRLSPIVGASVVATEILTAGHIGTASIVGALAGTTPSLVEWLRRKGKRSSHAPSSRVIASLRFPQVDL